MSVSVILWLIARSKVATQDRRIAELTKLLPRETVDEGPAMRAEGARRVDDGER